MMLEVIDRANPRDTNRIRRMYQAWYFCRFFAVVEFIMSLSLFAE